MTLARRCLLVCFLLFVLVHQKLHAQSSAWIDSVMSELTIEEKIGQLFMVATFSNKSETEYQYIERLVRNRHLGGLIFMQGDPVAQAQLANRYQRAAKVPLLIAQDAEWGPAMRLDGVPSFPKNMTLGAIADDSLLYHMGRSMAGQLRRIGVNMNFAPVVDVNNNRLNPVINYRSFGESRYNVARKGLMLTRGLQDYGVLACAKHFPGHGDTETDSHFDLPVISHDQARLDTIELYPFSQLADRGVAAVMVAHLYIPALDPTPNQATTLSPRVVQGLLRDEMGYEGLIVTDALNMQGVAKYYPDGEIALRAFIAGNDILLFPQNLPRCIELIQEAVADGRIEEAELDRRVRRILKAKYDAGLNRYRPVSLIGVREYLNDPQTEVLIKELYEASVTLAKNENRLLPLGDLDRRRIAYLQIGGGSGNSFDRTLKKYARVENFYLRPGFTKGELNQMLARLEGFDTVIMGVFGMNNRANQNFGVQVNTSELSRRLTEAGKETILTLFGNPYALKDFGPESAVVVAYEAVAYAQIAAAQAIFGGQAVTGRLPVTASAEFPAGAGVLLRQPTRFGFGLPEEQGLDRRRLMRIDSLAEHFIDQQAMPGCEVLVLRGNDIVFAKGYGRTEYGNEGSYIDPYYHIYDLASVTKVAATTLCTMYLEEKGLIDLDKPISTYLPEYKNTRLASITSRQLLQHRSGLPGWLPIHHSTYSDFANKVLNPRYYQTVASRDGAEYPVGPGLYGTAELSRLVDTKLRQVQRRGVGRTRYSDVGMLLMGKVIESVSGRTLDQLAAYLFYRPMGMDRTGFNPHRWGLTSACAPTENDTRWRKTTVRGYVHDPTSACLGGVAGHAGLFANVYDLAKLGLMLKSQGRYGDRQYFSPNTVASYTRRQTQASYRGLGWDKPGGTTHYRNPVSDYASSQTFGHTGFTGTCIWVDPAQDLVFIFLSNRTYPYVGNQRMQQLNVREKIMDEVYGAIEGFEENYLARNKP